MDFMTHIAVHSFSTGWDALSNARLTHQIDLFKVDRYLRVIFYDLQRISPNYELDFKHTYNY